MTESKKSTFTNDAVPLNQAQLAIYLACQNQQEAYGYNNPVLLRFGLDTDQKKLCEALTKAFQNHRGLFASISVSKEGLPQMSYSELYAKLPVCEVENVTEKEFIKIKEKLVKPFDLSKERLFRAKLYKTEKSLYLFFDVHHVIFDGQSLHVLMSELVDFYEGKEVQKEVVDAFEASLDEAKKRSGKKYEDAKKWYLEKFADVEEVSLPQGDKKDNEVKFGDFEISFDIDVKDVESFCEKNKCSEASLTTAAFGNLLSLYTMNRKAAFASIYSGRHDNKYENTVSMFVKTLPVLCQNDANLGVTDYVNNIQNLLLGCMLNDVYSFAELVSNSGYTSEVLFGYQGDLFEIKDLKKLHAQRVELPFNATGEKLAVQIYKENNKFVFDVQYQSNL